MSLPGPAPPHLPLPGSADQRPLPGIVPAAPRSPPAAGDTPAGCLAMAGQLRLLPGPTQPTLDQAGPEPRQLVLLPDPLPWESPEPVRPMRPCRAVERRRICPGQLALL